MTEIAQKLRERVIRDNLAHDDDCEQKRGDPCRCLHRHRAAALDLLLRYTAAEARVEAYRTIWDAEGVPMRVLANFASYAEMIRGAEAALAEIEREAG